MPDFSGTWTFDAVRSAPPKVVWNQNRPSRFVFVHKEHEVTIDTGDGSLFAMRERVTADPLVYRLDGSPTVVVDHSLGDLTNFARKIRTELKLDRMSLITLTTHFSETGGILSGVTRVLTFAPPPGGREMTVERTGYRDNTRTATIPRILHHGRMEDDLIYATDTTTYTRAATR